MPKYLLFLVLSSFLYTCHTTKPINEPTVELKRKWMLVGFQQYKKDDLIQKKASIQFNEANNLACFMGCNQMGFEYIRTGDRGLKISKGLSTLMACIDMQLEADFSARIVEVNSYQVEGHKLSLYQDDKLIMSFVAEDWD